MIGINLFENPNLSPQLIEQIRDRDIVDFRLDYEFENVEGYYPSGKRNKINLYTKSASYMIVRVTLPDMPLSISIIPSVWML